MSEKEKDPEAMKQKKSHKPIDYVKLNQLSKDFRKCFVIKQELSAEQAFWFNMSNPTTEYSVASPVKMEAPSELPKCSIDKQCSAIAKKELFLENDRLLQKIMSQDVLILVMNSITLNGEYMNAEMQRSEYCDKCFNLDAEYLKTQKAYNDLLKSYSKLEKHCISLELSVQLNQEIFQKDKSYDNQNALEIPEYYENNDLKAQLQDKDTTICKLKEIIKSLRENNKEENVNHDISKHETINEQENSVAKLLYDNERLCKEINHVKQELLVYVRDTCPNVIKLSEKKVAITPMNKVKKVRSKPTCNKKNDRISQPSSNNIKNKVEAQPRKVNKKNHVVEPICDANVKHTMLNANS
ncbi:hypothetical protein Tco_0954798 [Tanacetum coccineum]|uniref:Uncharacterized protein n=1 Tax=Tanacetum coccineum TaxID=301880 RepID=A0ABQ5E5D4_9ASTR